MIGWRLTVDVSYGTELSVLVLVCRCNRLVIALSLSSSSWFVVVIVVSRGTEVLSVGSFCYIFSFLKAFYFILFFVMFSECTCVRGRVTSMALGRDVSIFPQCRRR